MKHAFVGVFLLSLLVPQQTTIIPPPPPPVATSPSQGSVKAKPSATQSLEKVVAAQAQTISDLAGKLHALELRVQDLEQREQQRYDIDSKRKSKPDLSEVRLDLIRFDCSAEQDRAFAMAVAERAPVLTYMGGAALNCTQRLAQIVKKTVEAIDNQQ
jgi:hypothetical protein